MLPEGVTQLGIALADLNHDGLLDIVLANQDDNSVLVLLNNGDGTFGGQVPYDAGAIPVSLAMGDFNNDGNLDIVTVNNYDNSVSVLLGNGDGTFQSPQLYDVGDKWSDIGPIAVAAGDFNRDGNLDIAVVNQDGNTVSVLLGNGDGTFQTHVDYPVGDISVLPIAIAVGDFNHDGNLDIVIANESSDNGTDAGSASVLLGNGDGTFGGQVPYVLYETYANPTSVAVGDFNHDGNLDIVTANYANGTVSILLGNGDGTFQAPQLYSIVNDTLLSPFPYAVAVGDFTGDGNLDIVTANAFYKTVTVLLNNEDGTFQSPQTYNASGNGTDVYPIAIAVGDLNNNGNLDLVTANLGDTTNLGNAIITILNGNGDGTFGPPHFP